jgi:uncharacterized protein YegL
MVWIALASLVLGWVGAGLLLLRRSALRSGGDYRREVERRVFARGEEIEVTLRLIPPAQPALAGDQDVVLAVDRSGSMGAGPGSPLEEALRAVENFVRRSPSCFHLGVIAFDHGAEIVSSLAADPRRALRALAAIGSGGGTAIDLALERAREALAGGRPGVRKTVILLSDGGSDREAALAAAAQLQAHPAHPTVIAVGFGPEVDAELLIGIAGSPTHFCHVRDAADLDPFFAFLAAAISGQMAVAGLVDEGARAPRPFQLAATGALHPVSVQPGAETRIVWSVPLLDLEPVPLAYRLIAACPGWHAVAAADGKATWRMPDGTHRETLAPKGPRILVLPEPVAWAWPLLNPLFWILFGRFFPCNPAGAPGWAAERGAPEPLGEPSLPALLPEPQERPYESTVRPALIVGLGATGERVLRRLEHRLLDRGIATSGPTASVEMLAISLAAPGLAPPGRAGGPWLADGEHLHLHTDLRPYLEGLRREGVPATRAWIPWQQWLADPRPLTTDHADADDRRKARLALLLAPGPAVSRLRDGVGRCLGRDGAIVLVGAADEAEGSGLLGEVAHVCAAAGGSATAVLVAPGSDRPGSQEGVWALARELERMIALRGEEILSDREEPPCPARRLLDRVVVMERTPGSPEQAATPVAELLWCLLGYPKAQERLPAAAAEAGQVEVCKVELDAQALPALDLWRWVRERTLATVINGRWLGLEHAGDQLRLPAVPADRVAGDVEVFWSGEGLPRPRGRLLARAHAILRDESPLHALLDQLPVDRLYAEQVEFSRGERELFREYCAQWCRQILAHAEGEGRCGLARLAAAAGWVARDFETVLERLEALSGSQDFRALTRLAGALFADLRTAFAPLGRQLGDWIVALAGEHAELGAVVRQQGGMALSLDLEQARRTAELALELPSAEIRVEIETRFGEWMASHGEAVLAQLRFEVSAPPAGRGLEIGLRLHELELGPHDALGEALRALLDRYRNVVLTWPLDERLAPRRPEAPASWCRLGRASARIYPQVREALEERDPFLAAALRVRRLGLAEALGVASLTAAAPPYVWPEESNAERIAWRVRNVLSRDPFPFTALMVHLLRDPEQLLAFMADVATGRLARQGAEYHLRRGDAKLPVGAAGDDLPAEQALDRFAEVSRRVVALGRATDGRPIPREATDWAPTAEEAVRQVEEHPLARAARGASGWAAWRDVVRGLVLEAATHGKAASP